ncbi:hypothetical protein ALC57_11933 [Trachymyrmex cornetzi]|uniref:THAP-type domain-containing protein n=1 Tax=Trachymyrmex cornetzi TaxID=471704 RepID=A0A195DSS9_9HYME|nr:hypothetical protein ALC57_11933 [Trachymyrmex cornetzi]
MRIQCMPCVLYRFPKNKELREKWIDFCGIDEKVLNSATKLYSIHFEEDAIIRRKNRVVAKIDAVPCTIIKKGGFRKLTKTCTCTGRIHLHKTTL